MNIPDLGDVIAHLNRHKENPMPTATAPTYRTIELGDGACPACDTILKLTDRHDQPSYINKYGIRQKAYLVVKHGPRGDRCAGSHEKPQPWLEASGLPAWDGLSDLDKGAALMHVWKRKREGAAYAREHYPARYLDHPTLLALDERVACRHALAVAGTWADANERLGGDEVQRLYDLALAAHRG